MMMMNFSLICIYVKQYGMIEPRTTKYEISYYLNEKEWVSTHSYANANLGMSSKLRCEDV